MFQNKTLLFFVGMLIIIAVLAGYGIYSGAPIPFIGPRPGGAPQESGPLPAGTPQARLLMGQVFRYGDGSFSVSDVKIVDSAGAGNAQRKPRGSYVTLTVRVTNTGRAPLEFAPSDFALTDRTGRVFSVDDEATSALLVGGAPSLFKSPVQPGLTGAATLAFDVPADAQGLRLRISRGYTEIELGQ